MISSSERRQLIIAIDGPAGGGKSTAARLLARKLGYRYVDTGALYRALGWKAILTGLSFENEIAVKEFCENIEIRVDWSSGAMCLWIDGSDVTDQLRTQEMGEVTSRLSTNPDVRRRLLGIQRSLGESGGVVMEGRDIGTVVFPNADIKFYLDAQPRKRAERRYKELTEKGFKPDFSDILKELEARDRRDSIRPVSPLTPSKDATIIDSTGLSAEDVVALMERKIAEARPAFGSPA